MKCISCESEINPKFKHAIEQNACPFCGGSIMEELLKSLLVSLRETMQKMQEYPDQLDDWMLSNYDYIKTDSPDLIAFVPREQLKDLRKEVDNEEFERKKKVIKVKIENGKEVEAVTEKIQSDSKTAGFFERAQIIKKGDGSGGDLDDGDSDSSDTSDEEQDFQPNPVKPNQKPRAFKSAAEKTRHLKEIKKRIQSEGAQAVIGEAGLATMIDPNNLDNADPEMVNAFESELSDGDIVASALPTSGLDDEDAMTDRIMSINMAAKGKNNKNKGGAYNEADMKALKEMHARVAKSKRAFEDGENRDGKGGFSRA